MAKHSPSNRIRIVNRSLAGEICVKLLEFIVAAATGVVFGVIFGALFAYWFCWDKWRSRKKTKWVCRVAPQ